MSLAATIKAMRDAGCSERQINDTILALDEERLAAEEAAAEERRIKDRDRKREERARAKLSEMSSGHDGRAGQNGQPEAHIQHAPTRVEDNPSRLVDSGETKNTPQSPPRGAKRGTRIPDDWQPDVLAARREGLSEPEALREGERFRDYFRGAPNAKGVKLDWPATWRNWCKNAVDRRQARGADPPKRGSAALVEALERGFPP